MDITSLAGAQLPPAPVIDCSISLTVIFGLEASQILTSASTPQSNGSMGLLQKFCLGLNSFPNIFTFILNP